MSYIDGRFCLNFIENRLILAQGKFNVFLTLVCGFGLMGMTLENQNMGFVMPFVKCDLELTISEQGFLYSVSFFGMVMSSHFWGFLADTWGRRKVMRIALLGSFTFALISAFAPSVASLIALRFLAGLWYGFFFCTKYFKICSK